MCVRDCECFGSNGHEFNQQQSVLDATDEDAIEEKKNKERKRQKEDKISTIDVHGGYRSTSD